MPPSLHLPEVVNNLAAQRVGDAVTLRWTTPSHTTDALDIKGAVTAEICREAHAGRGMNPHSECMPVKRVSVHPGPTEASDVLPTALVSGPPALLVYRVRLYNDGGRTAGPSGAAFAAAGAAPPPVQGLHARATRSGIVIEWEPAAVASPVVLERMLVSAPAPKKIAAKKTEKPAPQHEKTAAAGTKAKAAPSLGLSTSAPAEVHLQAANHGSDAGGTLDHNARKGETYRYTAQRTVRVVLVGHALDLRSAVSAPVTVNFLDIFPPATPAGLAAIPGNHSIDLSWEPVSDDDLAGYIVYRQETSAGAFVRINAKPVVGPGFSDQTAVVGHKYAYRVTAIDASGNESAPSATVEETLPAPQP